MDLKLLYVIDSLGAGGAERSLAELLPYFRQADISPVIVCLHRRSEGSEAQVLAQGFPVRFLDKVPHIVGRIHALRQLIHTEQPHILQTTLFDADLVGRLASIGTGVAVLSSVVNVSYEPIRLRDPNLNVQKLRVVRIVDAWTARYLTDHFHAITHAVKESTVKSLGVRADRVTVIERGRNPERLGEHSIERRARARELLDIDDAAEVLINVGRQEYQKGQSYLLEAMRQVAGMHPQAVLLIAGREGNASAELQQLYHQTGFGDRVRFLGHREDIPELLAAADLFVFPSLYEGLGGALIEAMALGLPIVATKIAAIEEVTEEGNNALLVEPANPEQLANAIGTLLSDKVCMQAFGKRSRQIFEDRFTLERSAQRMVELYHKVAAMKQ